MSSKSMQQQIERLEKQCTVDRLAFAEQARLHEERIQELERTVQRLESVFRLASSGNGAKGKPTAAKGNA